MLLTQQSLENLKERLETLQKSLFDLIQERRSLDDKTSGNPYFNEITAKMQQINIDILLLNQEINAAEVIANDKLPENVIKVGDKVTLLNLKTDVKKTVVLTDMPEVGKGFAATLESPIGKAIFQRKLGDEIVIVLKEKENRYKISQIERV